MTRVHTTDPGTSGLIRRMSPGAYIPPEPTGLGETLEIFERQLRRSFAAGVEREYVSFPPFQPVAGAYETAVLHLVLRTTGYVGGTATVKVVFDDSSDANNWATLITYTEASPSDGTYRYEAPTPFGRFLRVRLLISGSGGIGFVLCRGVLSVKRRESVDAREDWFYLYGDGPPACRGSQEEACCDDCDGDEGDGARQSATQEEVPPCSTCEQLLNRP